MVSIRFQFVFFGLLTCAVAAGGALASFHYIAAAKEADMRLLQANAAAKGHLLATFYNEEARVLVHSAAALYEFDGDERRALQNNIKTYADGTEKIADSYAAKARAEVEANLQRRLPSQVLDLLSQHLKLLKLYHAEVAAGLHELPSNKQQMVALYGRLNATRAQIGTLRRQISEALSDYEATAMAEQQAAVAKQTAVLNAAFASIAVIVVILLMAVWLQLAQFTRWVQKSIADFKADKPLQAPSGNSELTIVTAFLDEMQRQGHALAEASQQAGEAAAEKERKITAREKAVGEFAEGISKVNGNLADSATAMRIAAHELAQAAAEADSAMTSLGKSTDAADNATVAVAGACTEMVASTATLSYRLRETFKLVADADGLAREANLRVEVLDAAVGKIEAVTALIQDIAEQTNLLALNATIEAARAGESGRGFAVVAGEVKQLASRSARATLEIGEQIREMQSAAVQSADVLREVLEKIGSAETQAREMAVVVQQQDQAISNVAQIAEESTRKTSQVNAERASIAATIEATGQIGKILHATSGSVVSASADLDDSLKRFIGGMDS
jgi:methyl-accepting chemotaxis protein